MAIGEAVKEAIFLRYLVQEILDKEYCIPTLNDNQSAQKLSLNTMCNNRTKHIDMRHHFVREKINSGEVILKYVETEKNDREHIDKALSKCNIFIV